MQNKLAVYTTIFPGVEAYLADWYRSLREQTDQDFELWIGLDQVGSEFVKRVLGADLEACWVKAPFGATHAQVRQRSLEQIVERCGGVVLVDSDDVLHPERVATARAALAESELAGCALRLVDQKGQDLDLTFNLPPQTDPGSIFPRNNVFGFSNSAFRSELLKRCMPIPPASILVDWFLATRAWLFGAKMTFDHAPQMDYRQHPTNTARVRVPFSRDQVISDTALVRRHFQMLLAGPTSDYLEERYAAMKQVASEVEEFHKRVVLQTAKLDAYVEAFNAQRPAPIWWACVAYPALQQMWN